MRPQGMRLDASEERTRIGVTDLAAAGNRTRHTEQKGPNDEPGVRSSSSNPGARNVLLHGSLSWRWHDLPGQKGISEFSMCAAPSRHFRARSAHVHRPHGTRGHGASSTAASCPLQTLPGLGSPCPRATRTRGNTGTWRGCWSPSAQCRPSFAAARPRSRRPPRQSGLA